MNEDVIYLAPGKVSGKASLPSSKSLCHRAILCAALAEGTSRILHVSFSQDIDATIKASQQLGASITCQKEDVVVEGGVKQNQEKPVVVDCGESGSTLRFLVPVFAVRGIPAVYVGHGKLPQRPMDIYYRLFDEKKVAYHTEHGALPLTVDGKLSGGRFTVDASVSSQFITGLLLALPMAAEDSEIILTGKRQSVPYIRLTLDMVRGFGIHVEETDDGRFLIPGGQTYQPRQMVMEADASQAAFPAVAAAIAGTQEGLLLEGLKKDSHQGDRAFVSVLEQAQVPVKWEQGGLRVYPLAKKQPVKEELVVDAAQIPDLVPVLSVLACFLDRPVTFCNAERLRLKESDRLEAIRRNLSAIGANVCTEGEGTLKIEGQGGLLKGGCADAFNDHRIAMSMAVAALRTEKGITLSGAECVKKSWPNFYKDFSAIVSRRNETAGKDAT